MKDPQFFSGFQIFCGSQSATPLPTPPLITHILQYWRYNPIGSEVLSIKDVNLKTSTAYHTCIISGRSKSKKNLHKS